MKHDLQVTAVLLVFFILAQVAGLALINMDDTNEETILGPRPEMSGLGAFAYVLIGIAIGTGLILLIIRSGKVHLWKLWFFLAVFMAMSIALGVLLETYWAFGIAFILALIKLFKPNILFHNITEILMYAGLAVFIVPMFTTFWMFILLIAISVYDFIAVFKSKHMVKMAKFQAKSNLFAGLTVPYKPGKKIVGLDLFKTMKPMKLSENKIKKQKQIPTHKNAILGGGDIAFPLLFSGVVMNDLIAGGLMRTTALYQSLIITLTTTIALALLFIFAKKDKFYPAMPFVTAGCVVGYLIILII